MPTPALDERSREVLRSLIHLHVATGEPVGSESLARQLNRSLSPATLRNVMADLERLGCLDQPHPSSGRVPTDEGYRLYVDSLMSHELLPPREAAAIESRLRLPDGSPQKVMENACHLLSHLSRNVAFVLAPDIGSSSFKHIDLVPLTAPRLLVVMVSQAGLVTSKVIEVEEEMSPDQLRACANYLNAHFAGMNLTAIRARLLALMKEEKALYDSLLQAVISVGEQAFAADSMESDVYLDGASNILDQPEFEDVAKMRALFKTFEEKSRLVRILNACLSGEGMRIIIGHENPDPGLRELAMVTGRYPMEGAADLGLGVMGSTRMEYARIVALVDHVGRAVARALSELRS